MGPDADYGSLQPNTNGKQLSNFSPIYTTEFSDFQKEKLDLRQIMAIARRRAIVIAGVAIAVTAGVVSRVTREVPKYEGRFHLLIGSAGADDKIDRLTKSINQAGGSQVESVDYATQIQVLWSAQVMTPIVAKIQAKYPEITYDLLRSKLTIARLEQTKILEIRYQDPDPQKIKFVLDQIADGFINYSRLEQQKPVGQGLDFVKEQTKKLEGRVNELQQKLQAFRQDNSIIDPQTQGQLLTNRLNAILQQRQETQTQLGETEKLYGELKNQLNQLGVSPEQALTASALSEAPRYQQLLNKLAEIENKIAVESARFTENSPTIKALRDQQQNLVPLLSQEAATVVGKTATGIPKDAESFSSPSSIRLALTQKIVEATNQKQVLAVRQNAIAIAEKALNQQLNNLAALSRQYTDLQRELTVANESLNRFLAVRETLQIEEAQKTRPWQKITNPQQPKAPISPNVPQGILLGTVAGLLAGAAAGFLAEKMDKVFHSPDDLKEGTGLPILGTIPFTKKLKQRNQKAISTAPESENPDFQIGGYYGYNSSPFLEAFRSLYTNIQFISPDEPIRSLVISSSVPTDGKSTVSTHLAQAAAAMGQRVLLVDADLRRPQIHVRTDLPNVWGLSNVISSEINFNDVIQQSPTEENLFVLTAGQIPPDPTRLLSSKKMGNLVECFQEVFDLVIFDTPPLLGLADAKILAAHTDGIAMVVGLGRTDRAVLQEVLYGLRTSRARILGVIANGVKGYTTSSYDHYLSYYSKAPKNRQLGATRS
jgi:capsular exopolysaccharide synthesis family protein